MKFEVTVGLEKKGCFDNFFDAFKLFFEEIMEMFKSQGMAYQVLETMCWIQIQGSTSTVPIMFYDARDLAYESGILVMPEGSDEPQIVPPPSDEAGFREYLGKLSKGFSQIGVRMADTGCQDILRMVAVMNKNVKSVTQGLRQLGDPDVIELAVLADSLMVRSEFAAAQTADIIVNAFDEVASDLDANNVGTE